MKKTLFLIFLMLITVVYSYSQCYELVWSDEFNDTTLNADNWNIEVNGNPANNELEYYTARPQNVTVGDSVLTLTAIKETYNGKAYTSGRINSSRKFSFQYGKVEARMKLPYGQGIWPAFWMLGNSISSVGWPDCGEIDIMEMIGGGDGRDNRVYSTLHWGPVTGGSHPSYGKSYTLSSGIFADEYHTFTTEWNATTLKTYCDDNLYYTIDLSPAGLDAFRAPFYIILNLAVGGDWPGSPNTSTVFPQSLKVDYVRVYQTKEMLGIEGNNEIYANDSAVIYKLPWVSDWQYNWKLPENVQTIGVLDSNIIKLNWDCTDDTIKCVVTGGSCPADSFSLPVKIKQPSISCPTFYTDNQAGLVFSFPQLHATAYNWTVPADAVITSGQGTDSITVTWGTNKDSVKLDVSNTCGTSHYSKMIWPKGKYPYPDPGVPHVLPGIINAVDYDYGGEGVAYHDLEADNQGDNWGGTGPRMDDGVDTEFNDMGNPDVGWIDDGEWLEYTIKAPDTIVFLAVRVATNNASGGPFNVLINDEDRTGDITVNSTGGWANFTNLMVGEVHLYPDDTILKLDFVNGGFNVSQIIFMEREYESPSTPANLIATSIKSSTIDISWNESTDNVGVAGYIVYVDGGENQRVTATTAKISNLSDSTTYLIEVAAYDGQNNISGKAELSVTTLSAPENVNINLLKEYKFYPNPVNTFINIESEVTIKKIVVSNSIGQTLYEENTGSNKCKLDMESYNSGFYVITITDIHGISVRKKVLKL
jgi:beta-glucanase (GH16 family)